MLRVGDAHLDMLGVAVQHDTVARLQAPLAEPLHLFIDDPQAGTRRVTCARATIDLCFEEATDRKKRRRSPAPSDLTQDTSYTFQCLNTRVRRIPMLFCTPALCCRVRVLRVARAHCRSALAEQELAHRARAVCELDIRDPQPPGPRKQARVSLLYRL